MAYTEQQQRDYVEAQGDTVDFLGGYKNSKSPVEITCPKCSNPYPSNMDRYRRDSRCRSCSDLKRRRYTKQEQRDFVELHGDTVEFPNGFGGKNNVDVTCGECGCLYHPSMGNYRGGSRCPSCTKRGFDPSKSAILYYLRVYDPEQNDGNPLYKIGITNYTVKKRYQLTHDQEKIEELHIVDYPVGQEAKDHEAILKDVHRAYRYYGPKVLKAVGITEIYTCDVLGLDKKRS